MMIGYDIYDCFTMEHFRLRQRITLTTKIYCSRQYDNVQWRPLIWKHQDFSIVNCLSL
jgi:hypothetical protein